MVIKDTITAFPANLGKGCPSVVILVDVDKDRVLDTVVFMNRGVYFRFSVVGRMPPHPAKDYDLHSAAGRAEKRVPRRLGEG